MSLDVLTGTEQNKSIDLLLPWWTKPNLNPNPNASPSTDSIINCYKPKRNRIKAQPG